MAIQGFGNVGANAAKSLDDEDYNIMAVSDSRGGIVSEAEGKGLNITEVLAYKEKNGSVSRFPGTKAITNEELLVLNVDVLIPAALENQITIKNEGY